MPILQTAIKCYFLTVGSIRVGLHQFSSHGKYGIFLTANFSKSFRTFLLKGSVVFFSRRYSHQFASIPHMTVVTKRKQLEWGRKGDVEDRASSVVVIRQASSAPTPNMEVPEFFFSLMPPIMSLFSHDNCYKLVSHPQSLHLQHFSAAFCLSSVFCFVLFFVCIK